MRFIEISDYYIDIERIVYIGPKVSSMYYDVRVEFKEKVIQVSEQKFSREKLIQMIEEYYENS